MKISFIITTKNEEKNLENCLQSIKNQDFSGQAEIILVDNNSQDKTKEIARKYTDLVFDYGPERSSQRNFGVKKSNGEYFIFLDADMVLDEKVIFQCVNKARKYPHLAGLYIPEIVMGKSFLNKIRNFERSFYNATAIDGLRFIKKEKFLEVGGFDENLYAGEDWDLTKRIKRFGKTDIIQAPVFHNEKNMTLKKFLAKKKYYSKNLDLYVAKWGKTDKDIKKQLGFYYRFFGVFLENGKAKKFLAHPCLVIGVYFIKILIGINFVFRKRS